MNDMAKEHLITQLRDYLDQDQPDNAAPPSPVAIESTEQFGLFAELSALKTETKQQSRQVRDALDDFKAVFETLQSSNDQLAKELDRRKDQEKTQAAALLKPLFEQLLDLYDRLQAGCEASAPSLLSTKGWFNRNQKRAQQRHLQVLHDGQDMTLERLRQILASYQVKPMQCMGKVLNPHTMNVVETEHQPDIADGIVIAELRTGFVWDGAVLRSAQVKVNKQ